MEAELGRSPLYVWRSIWNSRHLLEMGLAWRVGDGSKISVWKDKWVGIHSVGIIQTPVRILQPNAKVSELLDKDFNWWNTDLVKEVFMTEEAELIYGLAVSLRSGEDRRTRRELKVASLLSEVHIIWQRRGLKLTMEAIRI
jgi:hypothetical protein